METNTQFRSYLAHFFSGREMFQINVVEKIETHISGSVTISFFGSRQYGNILYGQIGHV